MKIIIINGATATGKTTLAKFISKELGYKLLSKDEIKEALVETAKRPPNLRNWWYYDQAAIKKLYGELDTSIKSGQDVVVESDFIKAQHKTLARLLEPYSAKEIYCKSRSWTSLRRYIRRNESGERHPVHQGRFWYAFTVLSALFPFWPRLLNPPMPFIKNRLVLDTTKPGLIDHEKILEFIKSD